MLRIIVSWAIGIFLFWVSLNYVSDLLNYINISVESDSGGLVVILLAMLMYRIGLIIQRKSMSDEGNIQFNCWILGLIILVTLNILIDKVFEDTYGRFSEILKMLLNILAILGSFFIGYQTFIIRKKKYWSELKKTYENDKNSLS